MSWEKGRSIRNVNQGHGAHYLEITQEQWFQNHASVLSGTLNGKIYQLNIFVCHHNPKRVSAA